MHNAILRRSRNNNVADLLRHCVADMRLAARAETDEVRMKSDTRSTGAETLTSGPLANEVRIQVPVTLSQ